MRFYWLLGTLFFAILFAVFSEWANTESLYWKYVWFDVPMHFLGGIVVALLAVSLREKFSPLLFIAVVFVVGVGWEVIEYFYNGISKETNYVFDTALDLLMDTLGAVVVYCIARLTVWRSA